MTLSHLPTRGNGQEVELVTRDCRLLGLRLCRPAVAVVVRFDYVQQLEQDQLLDLQVLKYAIGQLTSRPMWSP